MILRGSYLFLTRPSISHKFKFKMMSKEFESVAVRKNVFEGFILVSDPSIHFEYFPVVDHEHRN